MKKLKVFKMVNTIILLLIMGSSTTLAKETIKTTQTTKKENLTKTKQEENNYENLNISDLQKEVKEKIDNKEMDSEKFKVENFKIENIYQKGETILVSYEHIKSGAKFVVWFEDLNSDVADIDDVFFRDPTMFFRYIPTNNSGIVHALEHFLSLPIWEKLKNNFATYELTGKILNSGPFETSDMFDKGVGFIFNIKKWSPKIVKIVTDELKSPTFLKDNEKIFSREKKRMVLELKERDCFYQTKTRKNTELFDRFIGGQFIVGGSSKDAEKLSLKTVKKAFEENIIPENMLIQISAKLNPDYKEIMKSFDENYLKNYVKKNSFKKDKRKLKTITKTEPLRQINIDNIMSTIYEKDFKDYVNKNFKKEAKLYWKIKNLSPKEKEIFNIGNKTNLINEKMSNEIKKLGYEVVKINDDENFEKGTTIFNFSQFDDLFCLDLYGNDPSKFEEETLKENAKKILNMIYERIKNFNDNELLNMNQVSNSVFCSSKNNNYRNNIFNSLMHKSFVLSNKPINEKFFDIEGQVIKDDYLNKRVLENLKKYKENFKQIIDFSPTYIDIFTAKTNKKNENSKTENETNLGEIERYQNPITFKSSNLILKDWAEKLTQDLFLLPNINNKGLCYYDGYFPYIQSLDTKIKKIEEYVLGKFITDFKKFKPTREQFKKLNDNDKKSNLLEMNELENKIKELKESLKNPKILKKLAIIERQRKLWQGFKIKFDLKDFEERLKNKKNIKETKKIIKKKKKTLKEIIENKDNMKYFIDEIKIKINNNIKYLKIHLKDLKKWDNLRSKITYEDFVNIFKNAEIKTSSHLEKITLKKHNSNC